MPSDAAGSDGRGDSAVITLPVLARKDASADVALIPIPDAQAAPADLGPLCSNISDILYPVDWQSAQSPAAWCEMFDETSLPDGLCLSRTSDGYNLAILDYFVGGEMALHFNAFYLYDPTTGRLVATLYAEDWLTPLTCTFRTPDGPANPMLDGQSCRGGTPLRPVCMPTYDAGSPG